MITSDPNWKYVNIPRRLTYIEEAIDKGTQWVVFEPNGEPLWEAVRRTVSAFLLNLWRVGSLVGAKQEKAFFVKCDQTTMTQEDIDNGRLILLVGVASVKPAEFVMLRPRDHRLRRPVLERGEFPWIDRVATEGDPVTGQRFAVGGRSPLSRR